MIWPNRFTQIALTFTFLILFISYVLYPQYLMPMEILFFGIVVIVLFYMGLNYYTKRWSAVSDKSFIKSLFFTSLFIRILFFAGTLLLIYFVDPQSFPFEIGGGVDSYRYHLAASKVADGLFSRNISSILHLWFKEISDFGYPTYVGILYHYLGKNSILVRLVSILFSSFTAVLIYKLAKNIYNEKIGRFAGILTMLMPALLWFDTALLKESVMIFLIILFLYEVSELVLSNKFNIVKILIAVGAVYLQFFFREFLAWLLIIVALLYFLLNIIKRKVYKPVVFFALIILLASLFFLSRESEKVEGLKILAEQSNTKLEGELVSKALQRGVSYKRFVVVPLLFVGSIITPFPSLLYFDDGQLYMVAHFFIEIVRNGLYFFAFLGVIISCKKRFKESSLILLFTFMYIFVLAISGRSFEDRFQLPSLPGIIILISVGLSGSQIHIKKWEVYLIGVGVAVIMWNLFKLNIRGLL